MALLGDYNTGPALQIHLKYMLNDLSNMLYKYIMKKFFKKQV